ncbi:hypothetical protein J2Z44_000344 [Clostridium punense]|uniref:Uncharacterized protein n=1 Tax=Clostridium punense TaxID=1054297 RepID=A0ABS4JYE8_9CLOT|nr:MULTISPECIES: hypothetical protein [Clostridium]EQB88455.1 hypothetical protein M918_04155 [Clostridium sp. BL8]MBP2020560.1 hypothetical protein [Clostridium punense]
MEKYYLYIVLTRTNSTVSKLIGLFTKDEYTHAAISLDKDLNNMYSFARKYTFNPFIGRFKHENLNEGLYKFSKNLPGAIIEIEVSKEQYEKATQLVNNFIENSNKYKYNYIGLIHNLLNKEVCYENRFLCSEFVYHILNQSSILDFNMSRNLVKPATLLNSKGDMIFKGNLKELKGSSVGYSSGGFQPMELRVAYE